MKTKTNFKKGSRKAWSPYNKIIKNIFFSTIILTGVQSSLQAQKVEYTKPSLWVGAAGGANFNFYRGSTQHLNSDLTVPTAFHDGFGVGLYAAPLLEFHRPDSRWGVMLQAGYDNRKGKFKEIITPCNCPADLSANLSYITVEPSLRFAPFKSDFYLFGGPRVA
nr:flagellar motor protein MotB [Bacteroidota bacterium]